MVFYSRLEEVETLPKGVREPREIGRLLHQTKAGSESNGSQ